MSEVLSVRLDDELLERVKSQTVKPRQVVTEALLQYFRYKDWDNIDLKDDDNELQKSDVNISKHFPDVTIMNRDTEFSKLEMEVEFLISKIDVKDVLNRIKIYYQSD